MNHSIIRTSETRDTNAIPHFTPGPVGVKPLHTFQSTSTLHRGSPTSIVGAASDYAYYLQEGSSIAAFNDFTTFTSGYVNFTVPTSSPYSTGYEFNVISNSGDWYQTILGYNWPGGLGCESGFHDIEEVWNNTGNSVSFNCNITNNPRAGDHVADYVYYSGTQVCMEVYDWTEANSTSTACENQPDNGSYFVTISTTGNTHGYDTGPWTEVVDISATSCEQYSGMPTVSYQWGDDGNSAFNVAQYVPWSDEWYSSGAVVCYSISGGLLSTASYGNGTLTRFFEASEGSVYGPHWEGSQQEFHDWELVWDFQTDTIRLSSPIANATKTTLDLGQTTNLSTASPDQGVGPFSDEWITNTSSGQGNPYQWDPASTGSLSAVATVTDLGTGNVNRSTSVTIRVNPDPTIATPRADPSRGIDVGQSVNFTTSSSGGSGGDVYSWSGLPSGCASSSSWFIKCSPTAADKASVRASVTDVLGFSVSSGALKYIVSPALTVSLVASPTVLYAGQAFSLNTTPTGGSGSYSYSYSGLPSGCATSNQSVISCNTGSQGTLILNVTVSDSNGVSVTSSQVVITVNPVFLGLPQAEGYAVLGGVIAAILLAVVLFMVVIQRRRRKNRKSSPTIS